MSVLSSNLCSSEPQNITADVHVCRCCLATDIKLYDLDEKHLGEIYNEFIGNFIVGRDNLPFTACDMCLHLLRKFGTFRWRCHIAKDTLLRMYLENKLSTDNIKFTDRQDLTTKLEIAKTVVINYIPTGQECDSSIYVDVLNTAEPLKIEASSSSRRPRKCKRNLKVEDVFGSDSDASETKVKKEFITSDDLKIDNLKIIVEKFDFVNDDDSNHYEDLCVEPDSPDVKIEYEAPKKKKTKIKKVAAKRKAKSKVSEPKTKKARVKSKRTKVKDEDYEEKKAEGRINDEDSAKYELEKETDPNRKNALLFYNYHPEKKSSNADINKRMDILDKFSKAYNVDIKYLTKDEQRADFEQRRKIHGDLPYICEVCGRGYSMEEAYKNHLVVHEPSSGEYECDVCKIRSKTHRDREKHINAAHLKRFICRQCGHVTKAQSFAKGHFARHAGSNYTCDHCGKKFTQEPYFLNHLRTVHNVQTNRAQHCVLCYDSFLGLVGLRVHMARTHRQAVTCGSCGTLFDDQKSLETHLEDSTAKVCPPGVSPCPMCGENFPSEKMMKKHHEELHKKELKCDQCDKTFLSKLRLATHLHEHRKSEQVAKTGGFICEVCGKGSFKNINNLRYHQRVHTGEKPYKCTACGKAFRLANLLQCHMLTHTDERRYKCSLCPKAFHQNAHRRAHMLTHTKERPFACTTCPKRYSGQTALKEHVDTAHRGLPPRQRGKNRDKQEL